MDSDPQNLGGTSDVDRRSVAPAVDADREPSVEGEISPPDPDDDGHGYYAIPENAFQHLPEEWQAEIVARAEDGRRILRTADPELKRLEQLSLTYYHVTVLKHVRDRLAAYRFRADMAAILELDMLTTAFVATYVRLADGGAGSGFSPNALPANLRDAHREIIELRNKRYAHVAEHRSVEDAMQIQERDGRFTVRLGTQLGVYIGGSTEWPRLVDAVDNLFADRGERILARLRERTGRDWTIAQEPFSEGGDVEPVKRPGSET